MRDGQAANITGEPDRAGATRLGVLLSRIHASQFLKFAVVGGLAFVVDAAILLAATTFLNLSPEFARVFSFFGAVTTTWYLNRTFTFATTARPSVREFASYVLAMSFGMAINYAVFVACIRLNEVAALYPVIALVPSTLAGMVVNFLFSRRILDATPKK